MQGTELERKVEQYDHVFLFCSDVKWFETMFARSAELRKSEKNIWIYSCNKIVYPENRSYSWIDSEEEKELLNLYYTYEFSDRFHVICHNKICGSLFNYIDQGLLSMEEMVEALLC